jgi:anti-sigma-K factor RskA
MSERLTGAERRALLAGDITGSPELDDTELELVADLLADPAVWSDPDPALEDRVVQAVTAAPGAPTARPAGAARSRMRARGRRAVYAVGAAAAAAAVVIGVVATTGGGTDPQFQSQLVATALAPRASASADVTKNRAGFRIDLDAHGLQPLTDGAYYQAWLKNPHGGLVSIGTFSSSDGSIILWSGVSPKEYRGISVTVEPDDDNPASSGRRVLIGTLRAT